MRKCVAPAGRAGVAIACWTAVTAVAEAGEATAMREPWRYAWNADPAVLLNLGVLAGMYAYGRRQHARRAGSRTIVRRAQAISFFAALLLICVALLSPLDAIAADLAAAHMVQHMLLMLVAAPLAVYGVPAYVLSWAMPPASRRMVGRALRVFRPLTTPAGAWLAFAIVLWGWHHPLLYRAALRSKLVHDVQHVSFFFAGVVFWRAVMEPLSRRDRLHPLAAVIYLFATSLHATVLGVFMTLSPSVWYTDYTVTTASWGLTPLEDQQLGGLIMWVPGCLVFPAVAAAVFGLWLARSSEPQVVRSVRSRAWVPGAM